MTPPTPGDWVADVNSDLEPEHGVMVRDETGDAAVELAAVYETDRPGEALANCRVMAAGKVMYEALRLTRDALTAYRTRLAEVGCEPWIPTSLDAAVGAAVRLAEEGPPS